ncbi:MAG TPA: hypothetical protein VE961_27645 [Pyrinomonadaceae bacterium]|nr:hypothetical protein [Pyrinomonadaceae bacterium]
MAANPTRSANPLLVIGVAGLVAGLFDITYACIFFGLRYHIPPSRIFQSVARGALGASAFTGGFKTALLGLFFHFLIALIIAGIFYFASRAIPFMINHAVISGLLYGLCVYLVMYGVVMRYSAVHNQLYPWQYPWGLLIPNLLIHMVGIGLSIALVVKKFSK